MAYLLLRSDKYVEIDKKILSFNPDEFKTDAETMVLMKKL